MKKQLSANTIIYKKEIPKGISEPFPTQSFEGMIGTSSKIIEVFDYIKRAAPLDISVLVLGENGTGKEMVAQIIHNLSKRKQKPFVIVDCGAIPENLAESLLFGHEKGAFTGAIEKRTGKFELAEGGTVFLDEIGELPPEMQVKLLRVLQEKEIERVGGKLPVKTNVRIIAATNKNLEAEVAAGRFRIDLYYRLYVFPIVVPALRERKEDIPELINFFCRYYCQKWGKEETRFSKESVYLMLNYEWPGNIRELEHFIQRNLLLSDEPIIRNIELPDKISGNVNPVRKDFAVKTINEIEHEYILSVLQRCNWKVSGTGGAAELLGMHPSTLNSKMKKLSIQKG